MKWIKCSDQLPDDGQQVLATDGKNFHIAVYNKYDGLEHDICDYSCRVKESFYWMPLPEGPVDGR